MHVDCSDAADVGAAEEHVRDGERLGVEALGRRTQPDIPRRATRASTCTARQAHCFGQQHDSTCSTSFVVSASHTTSFEWVSLLVLMHEFTRLILATVLYSIRSHESESEALVLTAIWFLLLVFIVNGLFHLI